MNILLVDDDTIDRELVKRSLSNSPKLSQLSEATTVKQGLDALENSRFDVILLDYRMPKVNGIEMVIELRNRPNLGNTAIVMMSASNDENIALDCIQAGAQDFLPKEEINGTRLQRAIVQARKRFELEQKLHESYSQVRELAEKDPLTGLPNRYYFDQTMKNTLEQSQRGNAKHALLFLDLDNFKFVNDTYGHEAGDDLIKQTAGRLRDCLRQSENCARLGGDEFAILLTDIQGPEDAAVVARRITHAFSKEFVVAGHHIECGISVGIALYPLNGTCASDITKFADIAMYRAKQQGGQGICFFEAKMQDQFARSYRIESAIRDILKSSEPGFQLHYQPVVDIKTQRLHSLEALIRWPDSEPKYFPDEFIPVAERSKLIDELGQWVIAAAVKQLAAWRAAFSIKAGMAINLSPMQLCEDTLLPFLTEVLNLYRIEPGCITLELTETALLGDDEHTENVIKRLSEAGFRLALDDFGTGYSSLSHLLAFPIDIVKIDRSVLPDSAEATKHMSLFKGLTTMLGSIGLETVVEGVENEFQLQLCKDLGLRYMQGYYLARPSRADVVEAEWLGGPS